MSEIGKPERIIEVVPEPIEAPAPSEPVKKPKKEPVPV